MERLAGHASVALQNARLHASLQALSLTDPLTHLFNRTVGINSLTQEVSRAKRNESPLTVLMLDLDDFKKLNDTHGHLMGDLALLHDSNGLAALREPGVRVLVVVLNNNGGGIFHGLPVRAFEPAFTPLFATPHGRELGELARFHDLPFLRVDTRKSEAGLSSELDAAWEEAREWEGSGILEIRTDRDTNQARRTVVVASISSSLGAAAHRSET